MLEKTQMSEGADMSDIVERLRDDQPGERQCVREARMDLGGLLMEAANEIERLRAALRDIARQPEGDEESAQAVARAALGEKQ
jgi:low affinity Fe/Cu permease